MQILKRGANKLKEGRGVNKRKRVRGVGLGKLKRVKIASMHVQIKRVQMNIDRWIYIHMFKGEGIKRN